MNYVMQEMPKAGDTVVVGMSGGVDSTLTALLLLERGCKVIGATMSLWDGSLPEIHTGTKTREACFGPGEEENIEECKRFCEAHGIEYHVIDVKETYKKEILEYFKSEYRSGRTPNPCIRCNMMIKFGALLKGIENLGIKFDYKRPCMIAGAEDVSKDQTYFLYRVPSETLEKVRFPLAVMKKSEVFELAHKAGLEAANREESQDFIGEEYFDILFADKPSVPGDIIDLDGHVLGRHRGIEHYTVGQRRGLGVAVNYPVYVHSIDAKNNVVVLAPNEALNSNALIADDFIWPAGVEPKEGFDAMVKIRLASKPAAAHIERYIPTEDDKTEYRGQPWKITFETPQRAVAPGQSSVLYKDGVIVGGGVIFKAFTV